MKLAIGRKASACASDHSPLSRGEIRPSGLTAEASTTTSPAPPTPRLPRGTRCQSFGIPSSLEYWHIGETKIRFRNLTLRRMSGLKSSAKGYLQAAMRNPRRFLTQPGIDLGGLSQSRQFDELSRET